MDRAWRWCIARTMRDMRISVRRGRPITRPNLERLFCRRWHLASAQQGAAGTLVGQYAARGRLRMRSL